ncbi:regulatory protein GemA [Paracoccus yeei]|uniref:GemA protein n=1 Tax=Paracoccus yeei TaxID=147645 RepID=A0A2D2C476_9RHOB|nr:regulatory protein GemA [Paracoccus yeei]ATQ57308.1 GemA protein [Paracoccus yeei]
MTISRSQKALIHLVKTKLGWDDDTYRQVLVRIAGVTSSAELDQDAFSAVMGFAEYCGFRPLGKGAPRYGNRPGMATFAQLELVRELWREVHGTVVCDDAALLGWLRKFFKVDSMRFLTMDGARKAITALKAWKARHRNSDAA